VVWVVLELITQNDMSNHMTRFNPNTLIDFWFSERVSQLWYDSTPEFDREVEEKFSSLYQSACAGELTDWRVTSAGCLALVILFDQYPLNVFRNTKESFAHEQAALKIAEFCIENDLDIELSDTQKSFIYMPFMHSEDLVFQDVSVRYFKKLNPDNFKFAQHHHDIVARFGRFPHRNSILGRDSTVEEIEYLASDGAFKG